MSKTLPEVPLAEIAKPISRSVEVVPGQNYRTIGVKWWGEGAYERQTIDGSGTAAKTLSLVRQGDLIINKIWVRHGSTAIAGADVDGCAASGEFPTFTLDESRVAPQWLHWQTKTRGFWAKCDALSQGTSGKNRIKPELFLTIRVPLPPLAEQQRVVTRIEELAAQIHEARTLRHQAAEEAEALSHSFLSKLLRNEESRARWNFRPLAEIAEINPGRGNRQIQDNSEVSFVPMRAVSDKTGEIVSAEKRTYAEVKTGYTRFEDGDVIFARITPCMQNGKSAVAKGLVNGVGFGSTEFHVARPSSEVEAKWLHHLFRHHEFLDDASTHFTGTAGQQRVPASFMREKKVLVPPMVEQRRIVAELDALQAEVDALKRLQAETTAELDALLPAILDRAFKGEL
jgi:type I restriction enzyme, S subunit